MPLVGGHVVLGPLTGAGGTHPMDVGATGRRVCGTGRQPDQSTSCHSDRTGRRTRPTKHKTPNPTCKNNVYARSIATQVSRVTDASQNPRSAAIGGCGSYRRRVTSASGTVRSRWILRAVSTALFCVQIDYFAMNLTLPRMASDLDSNATDLQWVISVYMLALGAFMVPAGRDRRHLRPPTGAAGRHRVVRGRVGVVRSGADGRTGDRFPRSAGRRCGIDLFRSRFILVPPLG